MPTENNKLTHVQIDDPTGLEALQECSQLLDVYGAALTEKQRACFAMRYREDLSFSEIAEHQGITPQAVSDQIQRTREKLRTLESKLGMIRLWDQLLTLQTVLATNTAAAKHLLDEIIKEGGQHGI